MISLGQAEYLGASTSEDNGFELDDIGDYLASTAIDIGITTWNSLVPESTGYEMDTGEVLHGLNEDMGQFYDSHKGLVNASSFIGGLFVPMLAASKAMKVVTTANGWVGKTTPLRALAKAESSYSAAAANALKAGGAASTEYRSARNMLRLTQLGTGVAEGMLYEGAFTLLMNDHAYMENNYTITDYAIGAGIGALVGPLRMWQGTKAWKAAEASHEATQQAIMYNPATHLTKNPAEKLQMESSMYKYAMDVDMAGLSETNRGTQLALQKKVTQDVFDQVASMSSPSMIKERKGLEKEFDLMADRPMFAEPSVGYIAKMSMANPGTFAGANKFVPYNSTKVTEALTDLVVKETSEGISFESGAVARNLLAPKAEVNAAFDVTAVPAGIDITRAGDGALSIKMGATPLNAETKEWLANYLVSPGVRDASVKFDRGFRISKKNISAEASMKELELFGTKFTPYEDMLDVLQESRRVGVVDPFFGRRVLGEIEAKSVARVGSVPSLKINTKLKASEHQGYAPFTLPSPKADKAYIDALHMKEAPINGVITIPEVGAEAIPKIQAIHSRYAGNIPKIAMADGKILGDGKVVADWLWEQKVAGVREGLAKKASTAQMSVDLNMPLDTIDTIIAWGNKPMPRNPELPMSVYTDYRQLKDYTKPPVAIIGEDLAKGRLDEIKIKQYMDLDTMKGIHDETVATVITTHADAPAELGKMLNEVYQSAPMGAIRDGMATILADIAPKFKLISSTDMALRTLGPLADHVVTMGRTAQHLVNEQLTRVSKAIEPTLQAVEQDVASSFQFAQLQQSIQALTPDVAKKIFYDPALRKFGWQVDKETVEYLTVHGTKSEMVLTDQMAAFIPEYLPIMKEQHAFINVIRDLGGMSPIKANGVWFPYEAVDKKLIAYKIPKAGVEGEPTLIVAHTEQKLKELVTATRGKFGDTHSIITRAEDSIAFNNLHYQAELNPLRRANTEMLKAGIAIADLVPGTEAIKRFRQSLKDDIWTKHRRLARMANADIYSVLDDYAKQATKYAKSGTGNLLQKMQQPLSTPEIVQRTMLNRGLQDYSPIMEMGNNMTSAALNTILHKGEQIVDTMRGELGKGAETDWIKFRNALTKADIPIPYKDGHAFDLARRSGEALNVAEQRIAQVQSLDVLFRLRFAELAHGGVTVLSAPVILAGEIAHNRMPMKTMVQGIKFMYGKSDEGVKVLDEAKELGYVQGVIAESKEAIQNLHVKDITKNDSNVFKWLTKASDKSEDFVREWAFSTGYIMAKEKFPTASTELLMSHAQAFTQRTMGNYVSKQRPVMFQGALGSMLGLYQTFMVTMGQNMFRYAEAGDTKAIKYLFGAQASMFGVEALPMFQDFNQVMGKYMSDDHMDVRSTVYEATEGNPKLAEFILYGLPSAAFGNSLYSRAAWQPRTPFDESGAESGLAVKPVIYNTMAEALETAGRMVGGVSQAVSNGGGLMDAGNAVLQASAAQGIWRPLARVSELAMGVSYDQKGEVISTPNEVYSFPAIAARVLGTRPLKETVLRNARYATSYYNGVDRDLKARSIKQLRRVVTTDPNSEAMGNIMQDYLGAGGTYKGWQNIYNKSAVSVHTPFANRLLEESEKQPGVHALINEYAN